MTDSTDQNGSGANATRDETAAQPEPATITADELSLSFDDVDVLEDVSLSVEPGEFVGFVGPNGAGKTTLLRAISGALAPDSGRVTIDDVDVHSVSSRASSRLVAVVPQDTSLSFSFPVRDVVEMGRHPHRSRFSAPTPDDRAAVERALEQTRTVALADRPIDEVSGGQRQRVVLARAIAQETPALLLDEPTASLDVNHQIETLELVRDLVDSGRTAVAAIHDLDLAARYCDRLVMLADGSVHDVGDPSDVLTTDALAEAFDANATITTNPITGTETVTALPAADEFSPRSVTSPSNDAAQGSERVGVHVLGSGTAAASVLARLVTAGVDVSIGPIPPGDAAAAAARRLGDETGAIETIDVDPFASLDERDRAELAASVEEADVTVLADLTLGVGNQLVLEPVEAVDSPVIVETRPFEDRNGAGEAARARYEACRDRGIEASIESVLEGVDAALSADERSSAVLNSDETADGAAATDGEEVPGETAATGGEETTDGTATMGEGGTTNRGEATDENGTMSETEAMDRDESADGERSEEVSDLSRESLDD